MTSPSKVKKIIEDFGWNLYTIAGAYLDIEKELEKIKKTIERCILCGKAGHRPQKCKN